MNLSELFNSLLKRGSMFILSENHFKDLLVAGGFMPSNFENESMIDILDIGAGDGEVTTKNRFIDKMTDNKISGHVEAS